LRAIERPGTCDDSKEWREAVVFVARSEKEEKAPTARSMAALHYVMTGNKRDYSVLALGEEIHEWGEKSPLQDIWAHQLPTPGFSGAGLTDTIKQYVPGHEGQWAPVEVTWIEVGEEKRGTWTGRSMFRSSMTGMNQLMIWGGLGNGNGALGDGWLVKIE